MCYPILSTGKDYQKYIITTEASPFIGRGHFIVIPVLSIEYIVQQARNEKSSFDFVDMSAKSLGNNPNGEKGVEQK